MLTNVFFTFDLVDFQIRKLPTKYVIVCLGLLCAVLLAGNIGQIIYYQLQQSCNTLKQERDQLHMSNNGMQMKLDGLRTNYSNLEQELDALRAVLQETMRAALTLVSATEELNAKTEAKINKMKAQIRTMQCQSGWQKFDVSCYFVSTVKKTWVESRQYCITNGADLVIINSRGEQAFVNLILKSGQNAWIGMTDGDKEGTWMWVDGTPVNTTYWQDGQPNSHGGNQDCGEVIETSTGVGEWNDDACSADQLFVCEQ